LDELGCVKGFHTTHQNKMITSDLVSWSKYRRSITVASN